MKFLLFSIFATIILTTPAIVLNEDGITNSQNPLENISTSILELDEYHKKGQDGRGQRHTDDKTDETEDEQVLGRNGHGQRHTDDKTDETEDEQAFGRNGHGQRHTDNKNDETEVERALGRNGHGQRHTDNKNDEKVDKPRGSDISSFFRKLFGIN